MCPGYFPCKTQKFHSRHNTFFSFFQPSTGCLLWQTFRTNPICTPLYWSITNNPDNWHLHVHTIAKVQAFLQMQWCFLCVCVPVVGSLGSRQRSTTRTGGEGSMNVLENLVQTCRIDLKKEKVNRASVSSNGLSLERENLQAKGWRTERSNIQEWKIHAFNVNEVHT